MAKLNNITANFIKTQDKETSDKLIKLGFQFLNYSNGIWVFVNEKSRPMTFDNKKVVYTNTLTFN